MAPKTAREVNRGIIAVLKRQEEEDEGEEENEGEAGGEEDEEEEEEDRGLVCSVLRGRNERRGGECCRSVSKSRFRNS